MKGSDLAAFILKIERAGFALSVDGGDLIVRPTGLPVEFRSAIRENKQSILVALKAAAEAESIGPCFCCGGLRFWVSVHGPVVCARCHPPATLHGIVRWVEITKKGGQHG